MAASSAAQQYRNLRFSPLFRAARARSAKSTGPLWALSQHSIKLCRFRFLFTSLKNSSASSSYCGCQVTRGQTVHCCPAAMLASRGSGRWYRGFISCCGCFFRRYRWFPNFEGQFSEIESDGSQHQFISRILKTPQPKARQFQCALELGKAHLNLLSVVLRLRVFRRADERFCMVVCALMN